MSSAGLAQGSRGCCPEKPAPPWPRALPSAPPEPLGSAWALGGARSPHRPSPLAPITLLCVHVSGMEKGPGLEDGPLLPHPGEGTSRSWNVKGNNSVQGGGRRARRVWARRDGALWWPGAELRSPAPACAGRTAWRREVPSPLCRTFRSIWQLQGQGPQTNGTSRGLGEEGAIRWLEPWGLGLPPGQGWGGLCTGAEVCCGGHRSPRRDGGLPGAPEALLVPELPWPGAPAWGPHGPVFTDTRLPVSPVPNTRHRSHGHGQTLRF